jgi:hypothetical protein
MRTMSKGTLNIRLNLQEYPVAYSKNTLDSMLIRLALHPGLSTEKMLLDQLLHYFPFRQPLRQCRYISSVRVSGQTKMSWRIATEHLKW